MKTAIWFSRHQPSPEQIEDAARMGYVLTVTTDGTALGAFDLQDDGDVHACVTGLLGHASSIGAVAIFGVFATPILTQIARTADDIRVRGECVEPNHGNGDFPCFGAWNIMRSVEGKPSTFNHRKWTPIGRINQDSCRWLV